MSIKCSPISGYLLDVAILDSADKNVLPTNHQSKEKYRKWPQLPENINTVTMLTHYSIEKMSKEEL